MYEIKELPVAPLRAEMPAELPVRVLLALPNYVTSAHGAPLFNVPAAVSHLLGKHGWNRAERVMSPRVWAPGWTKEQLRAFVTMPFLKNSWAFPEVEVEKFQTGEFPGNHEVVHLIGFVSTARGDPAMHLNLANPFGMRVGALRDALVGAQTRLLILQVPFEQYLNATSLAEFLVGAGGPAVLVVQSGRVPAYGAFPWHLEHRIKNWSWHVDDKDALDQYFLSVYANILHNRLLSDIARPESGLENRGLTASLTFGSHGEGVLRFDRWANNIAERIGKARKASEEPNESLENLRSLTRRLHRSQLEALNSRFGEATSALEKQTRSLKTRADELARVLDWRHESGGVIPLSELAIAAPEVEEAAKQVQSSRSRLYENVAKELNAEAARAPRVLNAGFANTGPSSHVLGKRDGLVEGHEYDFLVDVGPRWDKIITLVTGNAEFPEEALPPDNEGYKVQVVLIGEDFTPSLSSVEIWIPRNTGRSFPVKNGTRSASASPAGLRVRAPAFPGSSNERVRNVRARLNLYYENNLLQSALVKVGVTRTEDTKLEEDNSVEVDYVLTGGFHDVESFAKRNLKQQLASRVPQNLGGERNVGTQREPLELIPEGESREYRIALSLALNGDGNGQHRIIIKNHSELAPVWRSYNPVASGPILQKARNELLNCFWKKDADCNVLGNQEGLNDQDGKDFQQFKCDLFRLALVGESLYNEILGKVNLEATGKHWVDWEGELRKAIAATSVIQVARTGPAEYVLPWALLYDYPLPDKQHLTWCKILDEWSTGSRTKPPTRCCPYSNELEHQSNILCPYGFWGLRHFIEQPISPLCKSDQKNGYDLPQDVTNEIHVGGTINLAVAVTRDSQLDQNAIATHLRSLQGLMPFSPPSEADDWNKVCNMLLAPEIAYFLCHGEYDATKVEPYLGVGLRDSSPAHRVYPNEVLAWARTPPRKQWWERRPLIFINGCHTSALTPNDILSFVEIFAMLGASGVIGTEISVRLPLAIKLGESLLRRIAAGVSVGEAMYQVRWELVNKGNLLGLAYTPYCLSDLHTA